jgi:hypothetical protein
MSINLANNFCSACGSAILETAVICPKCGSPTSKYLNKGPVPVKSKTTAVVLSVFLGIWSWLYTYEVNKRKFWLSLIAYLGLCVVVGIRIAFAAYQSAQGNYATATDTEMIFWRIFAFVWLLSPTGLTVWAIIDNATKPRSFYEAYPKRSEAYPNSSGIVAP